jgi:hypothetical protein
MQGREGGDELVVPLALALVVLVHVAGEEAR